MNEQDKLQWIYSTRGNEELSERYDRWARDYDTDLEQKFAYLAPQRAVEVFARYVPQWAKVLDAGLLYVANDLHYKAVVYALVTLQRDARYAAGGGHLLHLVRELIERYRGFADKYLAVLGNRYNDRGIVLDPRRCGFRQLDIDLGVHQRRRDHKNNQQHKYHVDHRGDIHLDLGFIAVFVVIHGLIVDRRSLVDNRWSYFVFRSS